MPNCRSFLITCLVALTPPLAAFASSEVSTHSPSTTPHRQIVVSVEEQKLALIEDGTIIRKYPISTSRFGVGDSYGSYRTPLGHLKVGDKIGDGFAPGAVIHHRNATGEILPPNAAGRDPIVSRILWLQGTEAGNQHAYGRCVYIHGTPDEKDLGRPASYGCIRMRSTDVIELYSSVPVGTDVSIVPGLLPGTSPLMALFAQISSAPPHGTAIPSRPLGGG